MARKVSKILKLYGQAALISEYYLSTTLKKIMTLLL